MQRTNNLGKPMKPTAMGWLTVLFVVAFAPYALFGHKPGISKGIALLNGLQISLALFFGEPWLLLPNPLLAMYAQSSAWKRFIRT